MTAALANQQFLERAVLRLSAGEKSQDGLDFSRPEVIRALRAQLPRVWSRMSEEGRTEVYRAAMQTVRPSVGAFRMRPRELFQTLSSTYAACKPYLVARDMQGFINLSAEFRAFMDDVLALSEDDHPALQEAVVRAASQTEPGTVITSQDDLKRYLDALF